MLVSFGDKHDKSHPPKKGGINKALTFILASVIDACFATRQGEKYAYKNRTASPI
jgi:hypothetical protein